MTKIYEHDLDFMSEEIGKFRSEPPPALISEYVEGRRILPPSTPFPGFVQNNRTPYLIELMDNMSPFSPVQEQDVLKGAQLGVTFAAENIIAYWIDVYPAEILFVSATDKLLEKWATKRLEPLIDSCGFRDKIYSQVENTKTRRTGDKTYIKEFAGGCLDMVSAQSAPSLRSDSKRVLIVDEVDGAPAQLRTGEGNYLDVVDARTNAWGHRKKIFRLSTPTTFADSLITPAYESGDRRKFMIPCPHCGKEQELKFGSDSSNHGIRPDTQAGELIDAYYLCEHCHDAIFNYHKAEFLAAGRWVPTSTSSSKTRRSYHISSLYSPAGMLSWAELWQKYEKGVDGGAEGMRSFVNLYLGKPYKETGSRPKIENVIELRGGRRSGEVPDGVLYITCAIDVQRGSKKDTTNPPRLELEMLGHGAGFRTWSIVYRVIEGEVDDPYSGAWEDLNEWAMSGGMTFRRHDGKEFSASMVFIDSGDGNLTDVVYKFTMMWQNTFPIKGFSALRRRKREEGDQAGPANFKRYRSIKVSEDIQLYEISTNYYKTHIYNNLKIERLPTDEQRPGFCDFPIDYNEKYFRMLTAEEKRSDGSFHCPSGRRNEALDLAVYNRCAGDVYLDALVIDMKAAAKTRGATAMDLQKITHRTVLHLLEKKTLTQCG